MTTSVVVGGLVLVGAAAVLVTNGGGSAPGGTGEDLFAVERGSFEITIPTSGELAALRQIEIRNRFEYRSVITKIVDEGVTVSKGDILFVLDDQEIRNRIKDAEDAVNNAESALVTAQSNLDITESASDSEIDKAGLNVRLAKLALKAWEEGEVVSRRQELQLDIETAEINYNRLVDRFEESKRLVEQQFISRDEFKQDEIRMIEAKATLDQARLDAEIYEKYQYEQDLARKTSDVDQALAEEQRVLERYRAELETTRAAVTSREHQLQSSKERLAELQQQLEYCTVVAPDDGWVVYASSLDSGRHWRNDGQPPTVGTEFRRNDLVIVLPDTSQMIATVKVNEARSGLIEEGQAATVTSDALPDVVLEGDVMSIGVLAESGGWIDRNRRDYSVKILLHDTDGLGLKPSMRCRANIYVGRVEDTLFVPVQAVFKDGPTAYVYVPESGGYAQREIMMGESSDIFVQIVEGLDDSEVVLLREPEPHEVVSRIEHREANGQRTADTADRDYFARQ